MINLETQHRLRKRIWEVDCLSMDAAIAAAFDWRDLVNLVTSSGFAFRTDKAQEQLELEVQSVVHHYCHSENALSLRIETLLNQWFEASIGKIASLTPGELMRQILNSGFTQRREMAAAAWALGSDGRSELDCIRRKLHQRFQIVALRRLA